MHLSRFFAGCLLLLAACQSNTQTPDSKAPAAAAPDATAAHFRFSQAEGAKGTIIEGNWCKGAFTGALPIYPDKNDYNRRLIGLPDGIYKLVVTGSTRTASFFLRRSGEKPLEVFTGTQFPYCLSSQEYFTLAEEGNQLQYNSGDTVVQFTVSSTPAAQSTRLELEFPAGAGYGLMVHRCADCR